MLEAEILVTQTISPWRLILATTSGEWRSLNIAQQLKQAWQLHWDSIDDDETSVKQVIAKIDNTREEVRLLLSKLD
ncbi:hypothetical protein KT99_05242 [Shewanella benthica KT99]|uniref:Uncharacterized protein n=1 Tax=Shewanella benthica KT99 TaxID=314608 RepID=A9D8V2_9GAMM|nr:hypothetical protein KT99_05242 [Shewanella benthica KT99]